MSYDLSADPAVIEQPDIDLTPLPTPPRMPKVGETVIFYQGDLECAQEAGFGGTFDKMMEIGRHKGVVAHLCELDGSVRRQGAKRSHEHDAAAAI